MLPQHEDPQDASQQLMDQVRQAIDYGLGVRSNGRSLMPVLFTDEEIIALRAGAMEDVIWAAHKAITENPIQYGVLLYDGILNDPDSGQRTEALIVEAYERGKAFGLRFAQRYRMADATLPFARLGTLTYLGRLDWPPPRSK
jgi:hypothetical protein